MAGRVDKPFRMSLDAADRHMLVRQSAETWLEQSTASRSPPEPVDVEGLWLSALGAWLDLHGEWDTMPYSEAGSARSCAGTTSRRWGGTSTSGSSTPATSSRSATRRRWSS